MKDAEPARLECRFQRGRNDSDRVEDGRRDRFVDRQYVFLVDARNNETVSGAAGFRSRKRDRSLVFVGERALIDHRC